MERPQIRARERMRSVAVTICVVVAAAGPPGAAASSGPRVDSRLVDAMKANDVAAVRSLLKTRAAVNTSRADGSTALHWAAHWNDSGIVDDLLKAGAKVDAATDYGATPLYLACLNRSTQVVERLLRGHANPNSRLMNGETALMTCSRTGDAASVRLLLRHGADPNTRESRHQQTALMWASAQKHGAVVQALIDGGADVRARSRVYTQTVSSDLRTNRLDLAFTVRRGGSSPLLFAARVGAVTCARLLLAAGADVNDVSPDGTSALSMAVYSGHGDLAALLLAHGASPNIATPGYTALHAAVLRSDSATVKVLLARGANIDARTTKGTPLRRSSTDYNLPATLLGATPYLLAARFLEIDIMRILLEAGADPKLTMRDGTTPLMAAAGVGTRNTLNRRGRTVIDGAKLETDGHALEAVELAFTYAPAADAVNAAGDTALHGAAAMGYDRVARFLIARGAKVNTRNQAGQTPFGIAAAAVTSARTAGQIVSPASTVEVLRQLGGVE